ncbi:cryptochrome/photolyase family protein [Eisenibacter elegans]|uniref:cryptochrome/photolyase family protein n=1 Tax=Eisenibacter elegans TaxID=997 RepID=UPI00047B1A13|nr:cryptochrome/photolyase family protein [Eisenibacter elegans]
MRELRLILGDQLNHQHSWFATHDHEVCYVLMEVRSETDYVRHHIQKVLGFFAAMRHFAEWLRQGGHQVIYLSLDDPHNEQSFEANLRHLLAQTGAQAIAYQLPDEYRLSLALSQLSEKLGVSIQAVDTEHFLSSREDLGLFFKGKKTFLMESFYRHMRKRYNILMDGKEPLTGQWNYDADNRKKYKGEQPIPLPDLPTEDLSPLLSMLERCGIQTIGSVQATQFIWPTRRETALACLRFFVSECLPYFGTYQDAMYRGEPFMFHSRLSFALNVKLLNPLEVVEVAVMAWEAAPERISFAQLEGFVRQIIGWREYMRGVYWAKMPDYAQLNYFDHQRPLPAFFWTGQTHMRCMAEAVGQSLRYAYAHHIQRLMVTGNFALLAGIAPDAVDEWYLGIYIDAIEWVEITNTRGMSQFADGGIVGTKPYVSSANYIDKMSNYCGSCFYDKKKRYGERACPFNSLYWHFYHRHEGLLARNPRIGMAYNTWKKMDTEEQQKLLQQAEKYLQNLDEL